MVAAAEQGYHSFLDGLADASADVDRLVADMGAVYAFAYLTVRLKLEDPEVRAGLAAIAMVRLAQICGGERDHGARPSGTVDANPGARLPR